MICDTVFEEQVAITNLTNSGTPRNQSLDDTVNSLMFHNQDHLGMSEEDASNFDPDQAHLDLNKDALELAKAYDLAEKDDELGVDNVRYPFSLKNSSARYIIPCTKLNTPPTAIRIYAIPTTRKILSIRATI